MTQLKLGEDARRDLSTIYLQGVEMFGMAQADRYIDGLLDALDLITGFPEMARLRDGLEPPARAFVHKSHVILYDIDETGDVQILRIRHGLEDWQGNVGADFP